MNTYYCRWCRSGHVVYSFSQINDARCGLCGKKFVLACARCAAPLLDHFVSPSFLGSGEPVNPPQRPENCTNCGKPFPWNSKQRRFFAVVRTIPARAWAEFKSLSALQVIVLVVIVLIIIGVITWHDLVEILKGVPKK